MYIYIYIYILTTNFSRCCSWLRFAAQPKLLIFTLGIQTFVLPIIIMVHWKLCCKYDIDGSEKWYEHQPERVVEKESYNISWEMTISWQPENQTLLL